MEKEDAAVSPAQMVEQSRTSSDISIKQEEGSSIRKTLKKLISSAGENDREKMSKSPSVRMAVRRQNTFGMADISAAEVSTLMQKTIHKKSYFHIITPYLPLILCIVWILTGTVFYAIYDEFGWANGFVTSVNIGWSIAWSLPTESTPQPYRSAFSKLVSTTHTTLGAVFLSVAVMSMAQDLLNNKDSWIDMSSAKDEFENDLLKKKTCKETAVAFWRYYISKLRVAKWSVVWMAIGLLWYSFAEDFKDFFAVLNFLTSTLTGGGYTSLAPDSSVMQQVGSALYAAIGIPLFNVSLGLLLSLILKKPEDKLIYEKMVAPVTRHEQEFMEAFGIDDGDGRMDYKEYVILMAVRMGSTPPQLIKEIQDKFKMLDRKQIGEIPYADLMMPPMAKTKAERIQHFIGDSAKSFSVLVKAKSKTFDIPDSATTAATTTTTAAAAAPPVGLVQQKSSKSPVWTGKVQPVGVSGEGSGDVVVMTSPVFSMQSPKITPVGGFDHDESKEDEDCDRRGGGGGGGGGLNCSASIEALEVIEMLPEASAVPVPNSPRAKARAKTSNGSGDDEDEDEDDSASMCSIATFDGNENKDDDGDEVSGDDEVCELVSSPAGGSHGLESNKSRFTKEQTILHDEEKEDARSPIHSSSHKDSSSSTSTLASTATMSSSTKANSTRVAALAVPSSPSASPKPKKIKKMTFRSTMSMGYDANDESGDGSAIGQYEKMSLRRKEFFEEQEKLKQAQLQIEMKNNMSGVMFFWHEHVLPHLGAICLWATWLIGGSVFYTLHEDVSVARGLYMSTSIGYGLFWVPLRGDFVSNCFTTCHFLVGIGVIAGAMALLAQSLLSQDKNWYSDAMKAKQLEEALSSAGMWDDIPALLRYYWPKFKVYFFFVLCVALGTVFAACSFDQWGFADCLYFALSTMTGGGFIHIPYDAPEWCYLFVCFYVIIGVPMMSVACGILAHQIAQAGAAQTKVDKVNAPVTPEEIEKMAYYGIEDDSGAVDHKEYVILILVRIGAISPEIISVLQDRFDQLDAEGSGHITYEQLGGGGHDKDKDKDKDVCASSSPV